MGYEVCWRVTSLSGDVVCTIYHKEVDVEVQAAFSNGIVVRTRRTSNIETAESSRRSGWTQSGATLRSFRLCSRVLHSLNCRTRAQNEAEGPIRNLCARVGV